MVFYFENEILMVSFNVQRGCPNAGMGQVFSMDNTYDDRHALGLGTCGSLHGIICMGSESITILPFHKWYLVVEFGDGTLLLPSIS